MGRISMILAAIGFPVATVGLTIYGMSSSYTIRDEGMGGIGMWLMVAGFIAGVVGVLGYRASERNA